MRGLKAPAHTWLLRLVAGPAHAPGRSPPPAVLLAAGRAPCAQTARIGRTCSALQVSGSRGSPTVEDRTTCDDHWDVRAAPSTYAARCDLLVICSLSVRPAWVACTTDLRSAFCLRTAGMCPYLSLELSRSGCSHRYTVRIVCLRLNELSVPESTRSLALAVRCWSRARWQCAESLRLAGVRLSISGRPHD